MTLSEGAVVDVMSAEQISAFKLKLRFSDGTERLIDFEPFLRNNQNPQIRSYLDPTNFGRFRIEYGELVWDDYGLCFPMADLYEGRIEKLPRL